MIPIPWSVFCQILEHCFDVQAVLYAFFAAYSIQSKYRKKDFDFLLYSGIFSLILLFDDFFMVHDYLICFWILQFAHLKVKISSGFWIVKAIPYQAWV